MLYNQLGARVMDDEAVWKKDESFPRADPEGKFGYLLRSKRHVCDRDKLEKAIRKHFYWSKFLVQTPTSSFMGPPTDFIETRDVGFQVYKKRAFFLGAVVAIATPLYGIAGAIGFIKNNLTLGLVGLIGCASMLIALTFTLGDVRSSTAANQKLKERIRFVEWLRCGRSSAVTTAITVLCAIWVLLHFLIGFGFSTEDKLISAYAIIPAQVLGGEWWRIFTGTLIHFTVMHLALNCFGLLVYGRIVELLFSKYRFWLILLVTAWIGGLGSTFFLSSHQASIGISGGIFGLGGFIATAGTDSRHQIPRLIILVLWASLAIGLAASIVDYRRIDVFAHSTGFVVGVILGVISRYGVFTRYIRTGR